MFVNHQAECPVWIRKSVAAADAAGLVGVGPAVFDAWYAANSELNTPNGILAVTGKGWRNIEFRFWGNGNNQTATVYIVGWPYQSAPTIPAAGVAKAIQYPAKGVYLAQLTLTFGSDSTANIAPPNGEADAATHYECDTIVVAKTASGEIQAPYQIYGGGASNLQARFVLDPLDYPFLTIQLQAFSGTLFDCSARLIH